MTRQPRGQAVLMERPAEPPIEPPTDEDVRTRSELLPEELAAGGSADPVAQAQAVLQESAERVDAPHDPPDGEPVR